MAVAVDRVNPFKPLARPSRCKRQSFTQLDYKMLDFSQSELAQNLERLFNFTYIHKSISTSCLSHSSVPEDDCATNSGIEIIGGQAAPRVHALVVEVAVAMASGVNPEPASSGLGGAYFLRARNGETIAVAKPIDEEPLAFNNPKGIAGGMFGQPGIKNSIRIGETGLRESAAYLLDHGGFSGVPPTVLVKFSQVKFNLNGSGSESSPPYKIASLQRFVDHDSDAGDLGPSSFLVTSVHRIGILDVRLMNLDRHSGNILVRRGKESYNGGKAELVPIDHGFCLPESLDDPYFEWLHWPQALIPFSDAEVDYISCLDPYNDAETLRTELPLIRESSIRVLVLCTVFLKQATAYGLCLADIGEMMTREFHGGEANWSTLEKLCISAKARLNKGLLDEHPQLQTSTTESKTSKIPPFSSMSVSEIIKKEHYPTDECDSNTIVDNPKCLMRSLSFPPQDYNPNGEAVSFGDMDNKQWQLFLEIFMKLLPKAFEERKSVAFECKNASM